MNTDNVKAWTTALRTTKAAQLTGSLGVSDEGSVQACCLGIGLLECGLPHEWQSGALIALDEQATFQLLPGLRFLEWLGASVDEDADTTEGHDVSVDWPPGLKDPGGLVYEHWLRGCSQLNDDIHLTFDQIADLIDYFGVK